MKVELSKRLRGVVRELTSKAFEHELRQLLGRLADAFAQWSAGMLDSSSLLDSLDEFAVKRRRLLQRYETPSIAPMLVAYAFVSGWFEHEEVPPDLVAALEKPIAFYRSGMADDTISFSEED